MELNFGRVEGLPPEEQQWLKELKYIYDYHRSANRKKRRYYNGKVTLNEVNLGIALPQVFENLRLDVPGEQKPLMYLREDRCLTGLLQKMERSQKIWIRL